MRWLLACATAVSLLGGAEVGARQYGFGTPLLYRAAQSGYEMVPGQKVSRLGHVTSINNIGTRGADVDAQPRNDTFRVLGDSIANGGTMLDDEQIFPAVASREMTAHGCRNEIIDAATGGWSLEDEIAWVHQHGLFGARTVIWTINPLDLDQARTDSTVLDSNPSFPSKAPTSALSEISVRYVLPRMGLSASINDQGSTGNNRLNRRTFDTVMRAIKAFRQELHDRGVTLIVLYHEGPRPFGGERAAARAQFLQSLADMSVPVIEAHLGALPDPASRYIDMIHPNARGHEQIGKVVAQGLTAMCPDRSLTPRPAGSGQTAS